MKLILQEYGTSLLAALTAGMIFMLCLSGVISSQGGRGIYQILEEVTRQNPKEYTDDLDRAKYEAYVTRGNPVISCHASGIYAGENVSWQSIFQAVDVEQNTIMIRIVSVDGSTNISEDYRFPKSGIYAVEVLAVDDKQKQTRKIFQLPVLPHKNS